jgi:hypothetical protein
MLQRALKLIAGLSILALLIGPANAARVGKEFAVTSKGLNSSVARLSNGGFVIVWRGDDPKFAIVGQRYNSAAAKVGGAFVVAIASHEKAAPWVAALPGGGFLVTWDSPDSSGLGVWVQRLKPDGTLTGARSRANTFATGDQFLPTAAVLNNGSFVVLWTSNGQAGSSSAVFGQRYTASGVKAKGEFRVDSTLPAAFHQFPSVAPLTNGGFVAVFRGFHGTYVRRFNASAVGAGNDVQVNSASEGLLQHPVVAGLKNGGFVVVREVDTTNRARDLVGQRYGANGKKAGAAFRVNTGTAGPQLDPAVAALTTGGFVVLWADGTSTQSTKGRLYGANFAAIGGDFKANTSVVPIGAAPSVGSLSTGGFVAAWQGSATNAVFAIRAQRFDGKK